MPFLPTVFKNCGRFPWNAAIASVLLACLASVLLWQKSAFKPKGASIPQLALLAQYGNKDAARDLERLGPGAVPDLIKTLQMQDNYLRILLWQQTNAPLALRRALAKRIPPPNAVIYRESAATALGRLGSNAIPAIEPLLQALADKQGIVSSSAATALAKIGPQSVPGLAESLSHDDPRVRIAAMSALSRLRSDAAPAVPDLMKALRHSEPLVQDMAVEALSCVGPPAIPAVAQAIRSEDPYTRDRAIKALRLMGMPIKLPALRAANAVTVNALASLLDDPDPDARFGALRLLNFLPSKAGAAEPRIHSLTNDPDPKVAELARSIARRTRPR